VWLDSLVALPAARLTLPVPPTPLSGTVVGLLVALLDTGSGEVSLADLSSSMARVRREGTLNDACRYPERDRSRPVSAAIRVRSGKDLRAVRRPRAHSCWGHLVAAPLWPLHGANLGTLLRTCDAVGACLAVPPFRWVDEAVAKGNTLRQRSCVHRVADPIGWLERERAGGSRVVGVELAEEAVRLADLAPADRRTVMVLGHEATGIPPEALDLLDLAVEIPMVGTGHSLNVAVAGSLVLYKLAGLL
jgi:tRNA (guanosine-2'-O-)-methyltransferase